MPYTTNQLIANASFSANITSREFESLSDSEVSNGLDWLNDLIGELVVNEGMVPYESTLNINAVLGEEKTFIPNLIQIDTITFFIDTVRYAMRYNARNAYFGSPRSESVKSLPFDWYFERQFGGGDLYLYFKPDKNYPIEIHGIFRLDNAELGQDLSLSLDNFFITYLRYALAERMCVEYSESTPANVSKMVKRYESLINKKSRVMDLSMKKISTFNDYDSFSWIQVNLGGGYSPRGLR